MIGADKEGVLYGDRYRAVRVIGRGGMGVVHEVVDLTTGRAFALKELAPALREDPTALRRLVREAETIARLKHAHIVGVEGWVVSPDGIPALVMELLRGESLGARLARGPLPWREIARIGDQILSALALAHRAGVLHCDLKPENVFLVDGDEPHTTRPEAKLLDFGIARVVDPSLAGQTTRDQVLGTPLYMSPEQASGRRSALAPSTDVWAMGAVLHEMATGRPAFEAHSLPAVLYRVCHAGPASILALRPDAPPAFVALVGRALARGDARIVTVDTLRTGLRGALATSVAESAHTMLALPSLPPGASFDSGPESPTVLSSATAGPRRGTNVAPESDEFVGRGNDLDALTQGLVTSRVVTLVGPAGVGKTRLATHFVLEHLGDPRWSAGAWFVDAADARDEASLLRAIARALGLSPEASEARGIEALSDALAVRGSTLLVLDNLEQVIGPARTVVEGLCSRAPHLSVIATSREPLRASSEVVLGLGPLPPDAAMALFADRARLAAGPGATVLDPAIVSRIVQKLEAMPLALELAAAQLDVLSLEALLSQLEEHLDLRATTRPTGGARQETLRAAIAWSWALLSADEQDVLVSCSLFAGGFASSSAEAAGAEDAVDGGANRVHDALLALRDKSLARAYATASGQPRFALYEAVREFASEELERRGGRAALEARLGEHFLAVAETSARGAVREGGAPHLERLASETENLVAVHRRSLGCAPETAARIALALDVLLPWRGPQALHRALLDESIAALTGVASARRASLLVARARMLLKRGELREALADTLEAEGVARSLGEDVLLVEALIERATVVLASDVAAGWSLFEEATALAGASVRPDLSLRLTKLRGDLVFAEQRFAETIDADRACVALARAAGDRRLEATFLRNLGASYYEYGALDEAHASNVAALEIFRELGERGLEAHALGTLGLIAAERGQLADADRLMRLSHSWHVHTGMGRSAATVRGNLGVIAHRSGRLAEAARDLRAAVAAQEAQGRRTYAAMFARNLAAVEADSGRRDAAVLALEKAVAHEQRGAAHPAHRFALAHLSLLDARLSGDAEALARVRGEVEALVAAHADGPFESSDDRIAWQVLRGRIGQA